MERRTYTNDPSSVQTSRVDMQPRVRKTQDRHPYPVDGQTILVYWQWLDATTATIPVDADGKPHFRGIAQILTADDVVNMRDLGGMPSAAQGEEVIVLCDANGNKTNEYERIHHIDPMEDEPQRWWPEGVDPNISTGQQS